VQDIISANHQLRDGNFVGAQLTLGRDLTDEEIARRQITPSTLTGQYTMNNSGTTTFSQMEADQKRDEFYNTKLNELENTMNNGDTPSASLANQIHQYFRYRKRDHVDPAIWQRYTEVFLRYRREVGKGPKPDDPEPPQYVPHDILNLDAFEQPEQEEEKENPGQLGQGIGIGKIKKGWGSMSSIVPN
jgi:hypothetical protein